MELFLLLNSDTLQGGYVDFATVSERLLTAARFIIQIGRRLLLNAPRQTTGTDFDRNILMPQAALLVSSVGLGHFLAVAAISPQVVSR